MCIYALYAHIHSKKADISLSLHIEAIVAKFIAFVVGFARTSKTNKASNQTETIETPKRSYAAAVAVAEEVLTKTTKKTAY